MMLGSWERVTRGRDTPNLLPTGEDSRTWLPAGSTAVHLKHRLVSPPTYICVIYWTPCMCINRTGPCQAEESSPRPLGLGERTSGSSTPVVLSLPQRVQRQEQLHMLLLRARMLFHISKSLAVRVLPHRNGDSQLGKQTTGFRDKEGLSCSTAYPLGN